MNSQKIKNIWHLVNAIIANIYYMFPTKKLIVIGVTGTDGKTTVSSAIYHILRKSGEKAALISTVGAEINGNFIETGLHVTTPGPFEIQKFAKLAINSGCKYLVLEITSIGLDQYRDFGVSYQIGLVTNLSHEHLDYHGTMDNYAKSKFKLLLRSKIKLVTLNCGPINDMSKNLSNLHTYSFNKNTDFTKTNFKLPEIIGDYNRENLVGAASTVSLLGIDNEKINSALKSFQLPKGRMEKFLGKNKELFFIDFGHTPQALESALSSIKKESPNHKIISVFGAAGLRDYSKRPLMGKAASKYSDIIIITSEDPRTESQEKISSEIISGIPKSFSRSNQILVINDRQAAIKKGVELSNNKTICLFFGKGHEKSMNISGVEKPWDEQKVLAKALEK